MYFFHYSLLVIMFNFLKSLSVKKTEAQDTKSLSQGLEVVNGNIVHTPNMPEFPAKKDKNAGFPSTSVTQII